MTTPKEEAIALIKRLPDKCSLEHIMAALHFKQRVERGLDDIQGGRTLSHRVVCDRLLSYCWALKKPRKDRRP